MTAFVWPLALSWVAAAILAFADGTRRWVGLTATAVLGAVVVMDVALVVALREGGALELTTGGWPAGIGIRLRADLVSALFALVSAAVLLVVMLHELAAEICSRAFPALLLFLSTGLHGVFFTGDAFDFYVFFEIAMVASFVLAGYGRGRAELRATFIYVVFNLVGSVTFLVAVASLYHLTGTLDFEQIGLRAERENASALFVVAVLLFVAFGLKLGLFPFHVWVPVVYRDTRPAVAAALAGALANVGTYGILRFGFVALPTELVAARTYVIAFGVASALYGAVLALRRRAPREVIAYASVAHAGYLLVALGIGGAQGLLAALLLTLSGSIDKAAALLAAEIPGRGGQLASGVAATSIAGVPLTLGFVSKLSLFRAAALVDGAWALVPALVVVGALTIAAVFRAWLRRPLREPSMAPPAAWRATVVVVLALALVVSAAVAGIVARISEDAVQGLVGT